MPLSRMVHAEVLVSAHFAANEKFRTEHAIAPVRNEAAFDFERVMREPVGVHDGEVIGQNCLRVHKRALVADEVFVLADVRGADDLEGVVKNASDIRTLGGFDVVRLETRTTDVHEDVQAFRTDDNPVATEVAGSLINLRGACIEFADEALIMFALRDVVRVRAIPHAMMTGLTKKVVDDFVVAFLFHLHRALVDEGLLDVNTEAVLIHIACIEAVFHTEFVRHGLDRLDALFETDATGKGGSAGKVLRVVDEDAREVAELRISRLELDQTAFGIDFDRVCMVKDIAADGIVLDIELDQFITGRARATKQIAVAGIGRIVEDDAIVSIDFHREMADMELDSAARETGRLAADFAGSITVAALVVLHRSKVVNHDVAREVVATAVAISSLEEHDLAHRAVDRLNIDEVFNDRGRSHLCDHVNHVLREPSDIVGLRDASANDAFIVALHACLNAVRFVVQEQKQGLFLIGVKVANFADAIDCFFVLIFQELVVFCG